jgi:hypothetical protein
MLMAATSASGAANSGFMTFQDIVPDGGIWFSPTCHSPNENIFTGKDVAQLRIAQK